MITTIENENSDADDDPWLVSPDGQLALTITQDVDGDHLIGFHGFEWHVQASALSESGNCTPEQAIARFVENVVQDRSIIAVLKSGGCISDVWITEHPETDLNYIKVGEALHFRYWSGKLIELNI